ncbi:MAG: hypothetical protein ABI629_00080 [bacterium]
MPVSSGNVAWPPPTFAAHEGGEMARKAKRSSRGKAASGKPAAPTKKTRPKKSRSSGAPAASRTRDLEAGAAAADSSEDKRKVALSAAGPIPRMRIEVTQLQLGEYSVSLWDQNGMNPSEVAHSTNDDDIEDEFNLVPTLADLGDIDRFTLFWVVWIKALKFGPGARFFLSVTLTQGDTEIVRFERGRRGAVEADSRGRG